MARWVAGWVAGLFLVTLVAVPAARAVDDVFVRLGDIQGDVTDRDHPRWIRAVAIGSSVARSDGRSRPVFSDVSILKGVDSASPQLLIAIASGRVLEDAEIAFVRPGGSGFAYFRILLEEVEISGLRANANAAADSLTELVTLRYARIAWEYTPQGPSGGPGTKVRGCWDVVRGAAC